MSDDQRPKSYGDKLSHNEVNWELPVVLKTGEAITSTPAAIYIKDSDSRIYLTVVETGDEQEGNFVGFAMEIADGADSAIAVQLGGAVAGFSDLDAGKFYYLSSTPGAIWVGVDTDSAFLRKVGIAIDTAILLIVKEEADRDWIATDDLRNSNDDIKSTIETSYTKVKELLLNEGLPVCRIYFELYTDGGGPTAYGRIYKNGAAIGTERSTTNSSPQPYTQDFKGFVSGDLIQIYAKTSSGASGSNIKNMRLKYAKQVRRFGIDELDTPLTINKVVSVTDQDP